MSRKEQLKHHKKPKDKGRTWDILYNSSFNGRRKTGRVCLDERKP